MTDETTIPILPCHSISEIVTFYSTLGFEIPYQSIRPSPYAVVKRGGIELHFFSMRGYEPANSYSTCAVLVSDVDALYQVFSTGLRQHYGKFPTVGIPRMTRLRDKSGGRGFVVIDPGGNWIRISQRTETLETDTSELDQAISSKLLRLVSTAETLAEKGDVSAAAKLLDKALAQEESAPVAERVQALIVRAELAVTMDDPQFAGHLLAIVRDTPLADEERTALSVDLQRAADLEQMLD